MSLSLGMKAQIRSMIFVAGEPIPYFWPMRAFIHHNPLHGLEKMSFEEAVAEGKRLFHGEGFLPRSTYQQYYREGKIEPKKLDCGLARFLTAQRDQYKSIDGIDAKVWLTKLLTEVNTAVTVADSVVEAPGVHAALHGATIPDSNDNESANTGFDHLLANTNEKILASCPLYESLDTLFGTGIGDELDELVIKSCLDFFDEGQSVWGMPDREQGFFVAWRAVAQQNARLFLRGSQMRDTLAVAEEPETIIAHVMESLGVSREHWMSCFRNELTRLHGWTGFIRWRCSARYYHHGNKFPGDLVDYLAVRLTLALALIRERADNKVPQDARQLQQFIQNNPVEAFLRREFYGKTVLPAWAQRVGATLLSANKKQIDKLGREYIKAKRAREAESTAGVLKQLANLAGETAALDNMTAEALEQLLNLLNKAEKHEGVLWLEAMESTAMDELLHGVHSVIADNKAAETKGKRPFAQALFCIDTRSERLRRHLESVGDYQTYGIAGFFGVPVSFMELGKGNETHLCPVLLTPKNLVMEMSVNDSRDPVALTALGKALHELKESVLTPFVTVEAIGLLFGFDMFGKTLAPRLYNHWRSNLHHVKPHTHLLIDKLSREQADSIVRAVQRAVIANAVEHELQVPSEDIKDDLIREVREVSLGHTDKAPLLQQRLKLDIKATWVFIEKLRKIYRVNSADARMQMERLGRIGFTLDEQVGFVSQALRSIGMSENFSRFILAVGHGSQSENNPYESALDCGACGGNPGLFNARIFANMANKPTVRQRLKEHGIDIPDDAWFVPAMHNTTTDEVVMHDLDLLPSSHTIYVDRLQKGLVSACKLCTQERMPSLEFASDVNNAEDADKRAQRNAMDWSQVRPEWGLSRNVYFIIGRRALTKTHSLGGRAFLHSYDYRVDRKHRLLETIMTGPLVVGQWINMEHYFSTVDNEHYGSGSKVYHNVAGRFGVMSGNLSDLRTGLPAQTVLANGQPYHEPMRLITMVEAPFEMVIEAINRVAVVRRLLNNGWIRVMIFDPESGNTHIHTGGEWQVYANSSHADMVIEKEAVTL